MMTLSSNVLVAWMARMDLRLAEHVFHDKLQRYDLTRRLDISKIHLACIDI